MGDVLFGTLLGYGKQFAVLRSYVRGIAMDYPIGSFPLSVGQNWTLQTPVSMGDFPRVTTLKNEFWNWSSNTYSPDWIWDTFYDSNSTGGHYATYPLYVEIKTHPNTLARYLFFNSHVYDEVFYNDLPPAPPTYWGPDP
jgi:hypothetical protein